MSSQLSRPFKAMHAPKPSTPSNAASINSNPNSPNIAITQEPRNTSLLSSQRGLLLSPLLSKLAGILGAVAEPLAVEVEDVRRDNKRDGSGREDEARDGELPFGAGSDVGVKGCGVEGGDTGKEVAAETVAAGGAGGVFTVGGDLGGS